MCQVYIEKQKGEILGVVIVESGWGSILPTVIIASLMHAGPAAKSGRLNIGDQIMTVNGTSLVGLPLSTCQSIIKVSSFNSSQHTEDSLKPQLDSIPHSVMPKHHHMGPLLIIYVGIHGIYSFIRYKFV